MSTAHITHPVIFGVSGPEITAWEAAFFADVKPLGFILFGRNIETSEQVCALCKDLRHAVSWNAPILIDQEGGRVQRLIPPIVRQWSPPLDHAIVAGDKGEDVFFARFALIAHELRGLGIDVNCAPCLDIAREITHTFLRNRCYGTTAEQVTRLGRAAFNGTLHGGVVPIIKHMPGHGLAVKDTHHGLSRVAEPLEYLMQNDFAVFGAFADAPVGMSAHIIFEALDHSNPATISSTVISFLRDKLGFSGLLLSDDLSMSALPGSLPERAERLLAAGCDIVLHCSGDSYEMEDIAKVLPRVQGHTSTRIQDLMALRQELAQPILDIDALTAQLYGTR